MATMTVAFKGTALREVERLFTKGTVSGLGDGQLLSRFLAHRDEMAFAVIVERHGLMVLSVCRGVLRDAHDAEDVFQATFLTLARKGGSLWVKESLGGWLHRVAFRLALDAKAAADRRRQAEQKAGELFAQNEGLTTPPDDLRCVVLGEVDRLPERLRLPLVLCDLQGLTRQEAAVQLGWTEGALRGRLTKARSLLRDRLSRRGVTLSSAALAGLLGVTSASAAVSEAWIKGTVKAVMEATAASASVGLAGGFARSLSLSRGKAVATLLAAVGVLAGMSVVGPTPPSRADASPPVVRTAPLKAQASRKDEPGKRLKYHGRVVDPAGRPVAGASLYLVWYEEFGHAYPRRGTTSADGRFAFEVSESEYAHVDPDQRSRIPVAAFAKGFGFAMSDTRERSKNGELTLKLVEDFPVDGRVLNLEGQPVAGVKVRPWVVWGSLEGNLDPWIDALKRLEESKHPLDLTAKYLKVGLPLPDSPLSPIPAATTDAQGRFHLAGLGRERFVYMFVEGGSTQLTEKFVITRDTEPLVILSDPQNPASDLVTVHGAKSQMVVSPGRVVQGVVRDRKTGKPLAGMRVRSFKLAGNPVGNNPIISTTTDQEGRYQLLGMPWGPGNEITVKGPNDSPYFPVLVKLVDPLGMTLINCDIAMNQGMIVRGRVVDKKTNKPVKSSVCYHAEPNNPHLDKAQEFRQLPSHVFSLQAETDSQGYFRCPVLPGRGILLVEAMNNEYPWIESKDWFKVGDYVPLVEYIGHAYRKIDITVGQPIESIEFKLDPKNSVIGTILDPEGKPLAGSFVYGLGSIGGWTYEPLPESGFQVHALESKPDDARVPTKEKVPQRTLIFFHKGRKLAGWRDLFGDESQPLSVSLEPSGAVSGRVLDEEKMPRADVFLDVWILGKSRLGGGEIQHHAAPFHIEADGRFRLEGLAPGLRYRVTVSSGRLNPNRRSVTLEPLKSGEHRELGDITLPRNADGTTP